MQSSYIVLCLAALAVNQVLSAVISQQPEQDKVDALEEQRSDELQSQIRNYVTQMREREQRRMLEAARERAIFAAADPRNFYETVNSNSDRDSANVNANSEGIPASDNVESPEKRAQSFVRFGKRAQTFVRFGKRAQTFVRFG